ncbi:hypothetical protein LINGRAPRIM_LOCUS2571 [Linum grandiflorum]
MDISSITSKVISHGFLVVGCLYLDPHSCVCGYCCYVTRRKYFSNEEQDAT